MCVYVWVHVFKCVCVQRKSHVPLMTIKCTRLEVLSSSVDYTRNANRTNHYLNGVSG